MHGLISGFSILFHESVFLMYCTIQYCISMVLYQYHTVLMTVPLQYKLFEIRVCDTRCFVLSVKTALTIWNLLYFHINLRIFLFWFFDLSLSFLLRSLIPSWRHHPHGLKIHIPLKGFPGGSDGKESPCNAADLGSIPGLGRSPGGVHGNPSQYSFLDNPHG